MKNLRSLFGLCLLAAAVYCAWLVLPAFIANFEFQDSLDDAARMGTTDRTKSLDDIRATVLHQAASQNINIAPEQVQVERRDDDVLIWGDYTVHVNLPLHPFDLHFQPTSKSKKRLM